MITGLPHLGSPVWPDQYRLDRLTSEATEIMRSTTAALQGSGSIDPHTVSFLKAARLNASYSVACASYGNLFEAMESTLSATKHLHMADLTFMMG